MTDQPKKTHSWEYCGFKLGRKSVNFLEAKDESGGINLHRIVRLW